MRKITLILVIIIFLFGGSALAEKEVNVPFGAIKPSCYGKLDMTKTEFFLSEVGKECVIEEWLEENIFENIKQKQTETTKAPAETYIKCEAQVVLKSIELIYNNHVGNEWSFGVAVNGEKQRVSSYVSDKIVFRDTFSDYLKLEIEAIAIEDDKWDDKGVNSATRNFTCPDLEENQRLLDICVTVIEDGGRYKGNEAKWKFVFEIEIKDKANKPPKSGFTYSPAKPKVGKKVKFKDSSYDPDGTILERNWEFGDGVTSTRQSPKHSYASPGKYYVCLTVEDNKGATDEDCKTIIIESVQTWTLKGPLCIIAQDGTGHRIFRSTLEKKVGNIGLVGFEAISKHSVRLYKINTIALFNPSSHEPYPRNYLDLLPLSKEKALEYPIPFIYFSKDDDGFVRGIIVARDPEGYYKIAQIFVKNEIPLYTQLLLVNNHLRKIKN